MKTQLLTRDNPQDAFTDAIESGALTVIKTDSNYAGKYMYMYTADNVDYFMHISTRQYDVENSRVQS